MEKLKPVKILLVISGITAIGIGAALLFAPVAFEASAGIELGEDINLLSELRAPGGTLLVAGVIILLGAFISTLTFLSTVLSSLFYLSYGISRIYGILVDGVPSESLVIATLAELVIGALSLFAFIKLRDYAKFNS